MKKLMLLLLMGYLGTGAKALLIDDFSDSLTGWTSTVILDNQNPAVQNTSAWQISGGALQLATTVVDGTSVEQYAMIKSGVSLPVGAELQVDVLHTPDSQDIGLYVGGTTPVFNVRRDYIAVYGRNNGQVFSRGFDGTTEYALTGGGFPAYEKLFIARTAANTFETGYYENGVRNIVTTRTPTTPNDADVVGIYADVRAVGVLGNADNLVIISKPYGPSVDQAQDTINNKVNVTFNWNAGVDPAGVNAVDPDFVDQYVFLSGTDLVADPNLYYVGAAGDPLNNPASSLVVNGLIYDSTYNWAVVEVLTGHTQTLTSGSTLNDVDPNNIIGPTWSFDSLTSVPDILQQPANVRVFTTDPNAVFTCEFISINAATVLWYKSGIPTPLSTGGDIVISTTNNGSGNYTSSLEILTPALADEGDYYCTIDNGTPLLTSDTASLIIKQLLAQYNLDGTLSPAVGSAADAPTGQGKSLNGLAEPNSLLASNVALTFVEGIDGVDGHAVLIDPNQYVDFGTSGYPKASGLTNGLGRGLDEGTIIFWVKPDADKYQIVLGNFNDTTAGVGFLTALQADGDFDLLIRNANVYLANHVAGRPNRPEYDLTDGQWHMMAACWSGNTSTLYVDGQWVTNNINAIPTSYIAWQRGTLLGASRQASRHLLSDLFGGAIDNLRIYNYRLDADSVEAFAQEYLDATGIHPCTNMSFVGNTYNFDNTGSSYCKVDLADYADFASAWLADGLY